MVEVQQRDRQRLVVVLRAADGPRQLPVPRAPVQGAGQGVAVCEALELLLGALAVVDVLDLGDEVPRLAVVVAHERDREQDPDDRPVRADVALLHLVGADLTREHLPEVLEIDVEVVRMRDLLERGCEQLVLRVAGHLAHRRIDAEPVALRADERDPDRRVVEREPGERVPDARRTWTLLLSICESEGAHTRATGSPSGGTERPDPVRARQAGAKRQDSDEPQEAQAPGAAMGSPQTTQSAARPARRRSQRSTRTSSNVS